MIGLNDHCNSLWVEGILECIQDLMGEPLLHLQAPRKDVNHPCDLAEPNNVFIRNVCHMCTSYEWQHMVFTHGVQFNVFDNDHLTAGLFEHGAAYHCFCVLSVSLGNELHGLGNAFRCFFQAFPGNVFTQGCDDLAVMCFQLFCRFGIIAVCLGIAFVVTHHLSPKYSQ